MFKSCNLEEIENTQPEEAFEYKPCQKKYRLRPEDEISLDSIFSAILSIIEPTEEQLLSCCWDVSAKEILNEKQALLFDEKLYISQLKDSSCKLIEENKIFLEKELEEVGNFKLNVEESYDGYVVFSRSQMTKGKSKKMSGHCLKGKYDNKFLLICEKRCEFDYVDKARVEKRLDARTKDDTLIAIRETKINEESLKFKAEVNIKGRDAVFILDGGINLLMRYLIINNFTGDFEYYTMNLFGKIFRCVLTVWKERKKVRIFYRTFANIICVTNTQYFNEIPQEKSETYFMPSGKIVLHFWLNYNYLIHATRCPQKPKEKILPKLELMWKADDVLFKKYKLDKKLNFENAVGYLSDHPEVVDFLYDYIISILKYKPDGTLEFTCKFFQNMKDTF